MNGVPVGQATFDGKRPFLFEATLPASALREGAERARPGERGRHRRAVARLARPLRARVPAAAGRERRGARGLWPAGGTAEVGVATPAVVLDVTPGSAAVADRLSSGRRLRALRGRGRPPLRRRRAARGLLAPRVHVPAPSSLRERRQPGRLPRHRAGVVPGGGAAARRAAARARASPRERCRSRRSPRPSATASRPAEAVRAFLSARLPRVGAALAALRAAAGRRERRPAQLHRHRRSCPAARAAGAARPTCGRPPTRRSAAVNGEDALPDLAIGRLPAATPDEAARLVAKVLDWEDGGNDLGGGGVVVADNPDAGGDFEANAREVAAGPLAGRPTRDAARAGARRRDARRDPRRILPRPLARELRRPRRRRSVGVRERPQHVGCPVAPGTVAAARSPDPQLPERLLRGPELRFPRPRRCSSADGRGHRGRCVALGPVARRAPRTPTTERSLGAPRLGRPRRGSGDALLEAQRGVRRTAGRCRSC